MLDTATKNQVQTYFEKITGDVEIIATLNSSDTADQMRVMLQEIASLSSHIRYYEKNDANQRKPSFAINRRGTDSGIRFAGIPLGHEFTSLVLALLQIGGHPSKASAETIAQIAQLDGNYVFETYVSLSCQNCPEVVQALNLMSVVNPNIRHTMIDGALFTEEVNDRQIMAVPAIFLNGQPFGQGRMALEEIVAKLDNNAQKREADKIAQKDVFDLLVIGGGPAGASAAIYSARKGIRTGVVAERFGGQVLDTLGIENFISVQETEGPVLVAALEQHVKAYDVDVMTPQRATALVPGELIEVKLESGASLKTKAVVIATGARWRELNVPGEQAYRNRGVAYCPHCDGPLFRGKQVAVIGGGNSGVEAAIDLAGIVKHVTLVEFDSVLRADEVLQRKLHSLPNVTVMTSTQTTEVIGDGNRVNGMRYINRETGGSHLIPLDGIFVQIGLLPNTDWLKGITALSAHGEIEIDARGQTSVRGVFAAGDVTTVPYKQIIIAMGEGSKAALGAFDYLIRRSSPAEQPEKIAA